MIVIRFRCFQVQPHHDLSSLLIDHRDVLGTAPDDKKNKKNKKGIENRKCSWRRFKKHHSESHVMIVEVGAQFGGD